MNFDALKEVTNLLASKASMQHLGEVSRTASTPETLPLEIS